MHDYGRYSKDCDIKHMIGTTLNLLPPPPSNCDLHQFGIPLRELNHPIQIFEISFETLHTVCLNGAGDQQHLQLQEEEAVDAEDFDTAASLSARLDLLSSQVLQLTADVRSAEADCEASSAFSPYLLAFLCSRWYLSSWLLSPSHHEFLANFCSRFWTMVRFHAWRWW